MLSHFMLCNNNNKKEFKEWFDLMKFPFNDYGLNILYSEFIICYQDLKYGKDYLEKILYSAK